MKHKDRVCISDFIRFIGQIHHQQKLVRDSLEKGNHVNAIADCDYLEVLLCDWARDLSVVSTQYWQGVENCAKEIVANDLAPTMYDGLSVRETRAMCEKMCTTISRHFN